MCLSQVCREAGGSGASESVDRRLLFKGTLFVLSLHPKDKPIVSAHTWQESNALGFFSVFLYSGGVSEADKRPSQIPQELLSRPEMSSHSNLVFTSVPPWKTGKT